MPTSDDDKLGYLGQYIRAQRQLNQLSIRGLAKMAAVSDSYLSQVERGNYRPSAEFLANIAKGLEISPDELFRMSGWLGDDESGDGPGVIEAVTRDTRLTDSQKSALIQLYRSMVGDE
ncbi:helix-turn-helix domain-containing protein [Gordonia sp. (in: high G+C Gram-positive bacteria)]|uniref:helix-turn-helix domain-containing protein n=1 Tax=Gordonia sp. (in: high G+C Gram-positive bacteria) TaxID=84139 RepID=UPI0035274C61